jgi:threonine dehydrogenase-like Zn-dependent dehydrogenase
MKPTGGDWGGALADLVRVPFADAMLVELPEGVSPTAVASASDNLPDAWRAVAPFLAESPGADVLVVGGWGRSIALYAVAIAQRWAPGGSTTSTRIASGWRSPSSSAPAASRARRRAAQARSPSR